MRHRPAALFDAAAARTLFAPVGKGVVCHAPATARFVSVNRRSCSRGHVALQEKQHGLTETVTTPENLRAIGRAWVGSPASLFLSHSHTAVTINVPNDKMGDIPTYQIQNNSPSVQTTVSVSDKPRARLRSATPVFSSPGQTPWMSVIPNARMNDARRTWPSA